MYKRVTSVVVVLLLVSSFCYAQTPRNASNTTAQSAYNSKSNFTNISVQGLDVTGNPGMIEMLSADTDAAGNAVTFSWFLWVDQDQRLCMASQVTLETYASFPDGNFNGVQCGIVGSQS